jgi:hypothetical protein
MVPSLDLINIGKIDFGVVALLENYSFYFQASRDFDELHLIGLRMMQYLSRSRWYYLT